MGGSVRIPAAWCGVVGLKPSFGRIPLDFLPTQFDTIQHFGRSRRRSRTRGSSSRSRRADDAGHHVRSRARPLGPARRLGRGAEARAGRRSRLLRRSHPRSRKRSGRRRLARRTPAPSSRRSTSAGRREHRRLPGSPTGACTWPRSSATSSSEFRDRRWTRASSAHGATGFAMGAVDFKRIEFIRTRAWKRLARVLRAHSTRFSVRRCRRSLVRSTRTSVDWYATADDGPYHGLDMTCEFNFVSQCPALSVPAGWRRRGCRSASRSSATRYRDDESLRIGAALERHRPWAHRARRSSRSRACIVSANGVELWVEQEGEGDDVLFISGSPTRAPVGRPGRRPERPVPRRRRSTTGVWGARQTPTERYRIADFRRRHGRLLERARDRRAHMSSARRWAAQSRRSSRSPPPGDSEPRPERDLVPRDRFLHEIFRNWMWSARRRTRFGTSS
jgi:hypothetical protein